MAETENEDPGALSPHCSGCGSAMDGASGRECPACLLLGALGPEPPDGGIGRLGEYELLELLARGGMGVVYRAQQKDPSREVALKALPGGELHSPEARQRFRLEAEAMARLEHPGILPVYESGEEDGTPFFSMKLATGGTLAARIAAYGGKWRVIAELLATVAEAVQFAHTRGVLHRDLKPGNILFDESGQPFVSDFGLAKLLGSESDLTRTLALMGTPNYMAPELTRGGKDAASTASDVWSLGIMLYELLAGHPPFHGDNLATVLRQLSEEAPGALPREVPRDLAIITSRALQKLPARRYVSAGALADDLRRWLRGDAILARRQPLREQVWRWLRRHPAWAALLLLTVGVIGIVVWRNFMLASLNADMEAKNLKLREGLATALAEQAAARLGEANVNRREVLLPLLEESARQAPSVRAASVAASVLTLPELRQVGSRMAWKEIRSFGQVSLVTADLSRLFFYRNLDRTGQKRRLSLRTIPETNELWSLDMDGPSLLQMEISDSGRWAVLVNGGAVEIWDTVEKRRVGELDAAPSTHWRPFALSPKEPAVAWLNDRKELKVRWFTEDRESTVTTLTTELRGLTWSPLSDRLALATADGVEFWKISDGRQLSHIDLPGVRRPMHWSWMGLLAARDRSPEVSVIRDNRVAATFRASGGACLRIDSLPGTWTAVSVNNDGITSLWDMRDGELIQQITGGPGPLRSTPDGKALMISRTDAFMNRREFQPDAVFREFLTTRDLTARPGGKIEVSRDGRLLATCLNNRVLLWDTRLQREAAEWPFDPASKEVTAVFAPDSANLFASQRKGDGIYRRSLTWKDQTLQLGGPVLVPGTGNWMIQQMDARGTRSILRQSAGLTSLWEGDSAGPQRMVILFPPWDRRGEWSAGLRFSGSTLSWKVLPVYDGTSGKRLQHLDFGEWAGKALFSQDEEWMLTRSRRNFRLLSTTDWKQRWQSVCVVSGNDFGHAAISPDSRLAAVEEHTDRLAIRSIPDGRKLIELYTPRCRDIKAVTFSADSRRLFLLNGNHRLYEWNLDALLTELKKLGLGWEE